MSAKILLRIAAFLLFFHVVGHSTGMITRKNKTNEAEISLMNRMAEVKVSTMGKETDRSYDDFYLGFGISLSFALFSFGILLWLLGSLGEKDPNFTKKLLLPILFVLVSFTAIDFLYFFPVPAFTCLFASVAIVSAIVRLGKEKS